ncbi:NAD-dependent epimerase/dehydratase family protein [Polynucleobacter sp. AP-Sanab-80-C2]|uniref:NAD-dependent epimerase/dehydratase family protein n=1 Tax=Polynucleobacter sp. AP-Sanab-80-C2 TaxID=3108274 RepID=UPI002B22C838|nr:NAD-dependent epimerase/dehydratase family protein [Polynucleobacter sp. AP-Sanab-80-C2]MEA9598527.1 NAD-dependent epimerase/dehydratase family protein [Polynucleobacter sp. AP-Sanab-80-C2]
MSRRVLITGATGVLGRAIITRLSSNPRGDLVIYSPGRRDELDPLDLRYCEQIFDAIIRTKPDLIIHLAATFSSDFDEAFTVNVNSAWHILKTIEELSLSTRVLLIGSAAEYGVVSADENPIMESRSLRPVSIYGLTKAWQTDLGYLYATRGVNVVMARIFNLIGPHLSERLFIGRLHRQIKELLSGDRKKIEVGPLSAVRDYISVNDAVTQLLAIADYGEAGEVYHVASGEPITMRDLLAQELAAHGLEDSIVIEGVGLSNRQGYDVPSIYAEMSKTMSLLKKWGCHVTN